MFLHEHLLTGVGIGTGGIGIVLAFVVLLVLVLAQPAEKDDLIVERFRSLGAIVLPPTSMVEGGVTPIGYCVEIGGPFNPQNASHYSGGSSGGSAVAVALVRLID